MNQKSIITALGVAVVILIGTTVYFTTINKTSQPVATPNSQNYIEVKELGFKIPVSSSTAGELTYKIGFKDNFNDFSNQVGFSSKTLSAKYPGCAEWGGVITVEKVAGKLTDDKNKVSDFSGKMVVRDGVIKQLDGFFLIAPFKPQTSCSDSKALDVETNVGTSITNGLENALLITK